MTEEERGYVIDPETRLHRALHFSAGGASAGGVLGIILSSDPVRLIGLDDKLHTALSVASTPEQVAAFILAGVAVGAGHGAISCPAQPENTPPVRFSRAAVPAYALAGALATAGGWYGLPLLALLVTRATGWDPISSSNLQLLGAVLAPGFTLGKLDDLLWRLQHSSEKWRSGLH